MTAQSQSLLNKSAGIAMAVLMSGCITTSFGAGDSQYGIAASKENVEILREHTVSGASKDSRPIAPSREEAQAIKKYFCNDSKQRRSLKHRILGSVMVAPNAPLNGAADIKRALLERYRAKVSTFFNGDHDKCGDDGSCNRVGDGIDMYVATDYDDPSFKFDGRLFAHTADIVLVYFPAEGVFRIGPREAFAEVSLLTSRSRVVTGPLKLSPSYLAEVGAFKKLFRDRGGKETVLKQQPPPSISTKLKEAVGVTPDDIVFEVEADLSSFCETALPKGDFETK